VIPAATPSHIGPIVRCRERGWGADTRAADTGSVAPWQRYPTAVTNREAGHGRVETRAPNAVHVDRLGANFPHVKRAVKVTRWRRSPGRPNREGIPRDRLRHYSLPSAQATADDLTQLIRDHWGASTCSNTSVTCPCAKTTPPSRTDHGLVNLATLRATGTAR